MDPNRETPPPRRYDLVAPRHDEGPFDLKSQIPGDGPLELDIGFGRGMSVFERARVAPESRILGVEVKNKWAYLVEERRKRMGLDRVRIVAGDIKLLLPRCEPDACIQRTTVHFPDPWWKKRHAKRRVVGGALLDELARLMVEGGELFVQTDVQDRATLYRDEIAQHPAFALHGGSGFIDANPFQAPSNRECRALQDGLPIWRILAIRACPPTPSCDHHSPERDEEE